jgi:hypothetical protein
MVIRANKAKGEGTESTIDRRAVTKEIEARHTQINTTQESFNIKAKANCMRAAVIQI